jgi:branched-chain amino acid transport system substrate-binding protein
MPSRSVRLLPIGLAAAAALLVAACGSSGGSASSSAGGSSSSSRAPYVWGINAELSGPVSVYGDQIASGVQAYVDQVNAAGGINGRRIQLVKLDNAASESQAATNETQLATADKAIAVFGSVLDAECTGSAPVAERYQVPTACLTIGIHSPYIYGLGADNSGGGPAVIAAVKKVAGGRPLRFALMYNNLPADNDLAKSVAALAPRAGEKLLTSQKLELTQTDFSVPVASVVAARPDVVVVSATGPAFVSILKGLQASGVAVPVVYLDGVVNTPSLVGITASSVYPMGEYPYVDPASTDAHASAFLAALRSVGVNPTAVNLNGTPATAYITASAFGAALRACGPSCTGSGLAAELNKTTISLGALDPAFGYTASNHVPWRAWFLYHLVHGTTWTPVTSFPMPG